MKETNWTASYPQNASYLWDEAADTLLMMWNSSDANYIFATSMLEF